MKIIRCPKCLSSNVDSDQLDDKFLVCLNEYCSKNRIYQEVED